VVDNGSVTQMEE